VAQAGSGDRVYGREQGAEAGRLQRHQLLAEAGARRRTAAAGSQKLRQAALHHFPVRQTATPPIKRLSKTCA
jgi:hypothetical protein